MNLKHTFILFLIIGIKFTPEVKAQKKEYNILFYNVENLFDCKDDTLTQDNDFLPQGVLHWTYGRYMRKLQQLRKTIVAVGGWQTPTIIGLCEIENKWVLKDLVSDGILKRMNYQIVHVNSPDARGIDVAMLYQPQQFEILNYNILPIQTTENTYSRDILHVEGIVEGEDTLHLFINHWPSRRGGQHESNAKRMHAAQTLMKTVEPLVQQNKKIVIMGDFNDTPNDESIQYLIQSTRKYTNALINTVQTIQTQENGTYYYRGRWTRIDQFIVSTNIYPRLTQVESTKHAFLLTKATQGIGKIPYRTYTGRKYTGGISDHLPIQLQIRLY